MCGTYQGTLIVKEGAISNYPGTASINRLKTGLSENTITSFKSQQRRLLTVPLLSQDKSAAPSSMLP